MFKKDKPKIAFAMDIESKYVKVTIDDKFTRRPKGEMVKFAKMLLADEKLNA